MYTEMYAKLALALCIGYLLGIDRGRFQKPAGLRDLIFVTLSGCLCSLLGLELLKMGMPNVDMSRVLYAPIIGLGFLGSGVIIQYKQNIEGITTASLLLLSVILGLLCGIGSYEIVCVATLVSYIVLKGKFVEGVKK